MPWGWAERIEAFMGSKDTGNQEDSDHFMIKSYKINMGR
jgi:hypothetical protein